MRIIYNKTYLYVCLILLFTFIVFFPSINCELTNWDDGWMVTNNPLIRSLSPANIYKLFFGKIYMFNYQPMVFLSFAIEYHFFDLNPQIFHFTNILLHLLNVLLVFIFIRSISNKQDVALIAAILFAIHPMRVESVTWITTRRDVLYTFFYLLALIQYVKYIKLETINNQHPISNIQDPTSSISHYLLALFFFLMSCLSKGMAVSLSLTIVITDYILLRKLSARAILDKIPFFAISLFFGLLAVYATRSHDNISSNNPFHFIEQLQFAGYAILMYLYKFILPVNLSAFYPYPEYQPGALPIYYWAFPLSALAVAGFVVYSMKFTRKIMFGFGFFIATILFVLQLLPVGKVIIADRYSYIPYIGLFYLVGEGYSYIIHVDSFLSNKHINIFRALIITIILVFSYLTHNRINVWQNGLILWTDVVEKYPDNAIAYNNRGIAMNQLKDYHGAIRDFEKAIELKPDYPMAYYYRGCAKKEIKDYNYAIQDFTKAIELYPDYYSAYNSRGLVENYLHEYEAAVEDFSMAIDLKPNEATYYANRGLAKAALKDYSNAIKDLTKAIELKPDFIEVYYDRGNVKIFLKNYQGAIEDYNKIIEQKPNHLRAYQNRGTARFQLGDKRGACMDWKKAGVVELINKYCN
ncbi:MAG: tetratricopeptide repeat protein [Bacteroidota bacterium]